MENEKKVYETPEVTKAPATALRLVAVITQAIVQALLRTLAASTPKSNDYSAARSITDTFLSCHRQPVFTEFRLAFDNTARCRALRYIDKE